MLFIVEPFATAEIGYRQDRIRADFARANVVRAARTGRRVARAVGRPQRHVYRPARARG